MLLVLAREIVHTAASEMGLFDRAPPSLPQWGERNELMTDFNLWPG